LKRILSFLGVFLLIGSFFTTNAQVPTDSWSLGFGFSYPRYYSSNLRPLEENYGAYLAIQRDFTEHTSLRLKGYYQSLKGRIGGGQYFYNNGAVVPSGAEEVTTTVIAGDFDFLYHFVPCESVSPYLFFGGGVAYTDPSWPTTINHSTESSVNFKWNYGIGADWTLGEDWKLATEVAFNQISSKIEGIVNNNRQGPSGSNSTAYVAVDFGLMYFFDKGEPSKICQLYSGINAGTDVDYERVENIVKKYIPREVVKEVVVPTPMPQKKNWVLVGVNFDFNKTSLKDEAYPVLFHAVQVLLSNSDLKVEIQGYTDNVGSDKYNIKLSEKRAQVVKDYLVARGVSADRLTVKGYGKANPIAPNDTAKGRAMNRRIEFKVLN